MLLRFLAKRMVVLLAAAAAFAFVIDGFKPAVPLGILVGGFLALYKVRLNSIVISATVTSGSTAKNSALQVLAQILVLGLLVVTIVLDMRLFIGLTAGLLLLPLFICVNAFTERLGLTHNTFGGTTNVDKQ